MASIQSETDLDKQLASLIDVVVTLRNRMPSLPISIEIPRGLSSEPYLVFTQAEWGPMQAEYIKELCEYHKLDYHVSPLDGKLAVSLTLT